MSNTTTFNEIPIGKKFKTSSGIIYEKVSKQDSKTYKDSSGVLISAQNKKLTTAFYNTKLPLTVIG